MGTVAHQSECCTHDDPDQDQGPDGVQAPTADNGERYPECGEHAAQDERRHRPAELLLPDWPDDQLAATCMRAFRVCGPMIQDYLAGLTDEDAPSVSWNIDGPESVEHPHNGNGQTRRQLREASRPPGDASSTRARSRGLTPFSARTLHRPHLAA